MSKTPEYSLLRSFFCLNVQPQRREGTKRHQVENYVVGLMYPGGTASTPRLSASVDEGSAGSRL